MWKKFLGMPWFEPGQLGVWIGKRKSYHCATCPPPPHKKLDHLVRLERQHLPCLLPCWTRSWATTWAQSGSRRPSFPWGPLHPDPPGASWTESRPPRRDEGPRNGSHDYLMYHYMVKARLLRPSQGSLQILLYSFHSYRIKDSQKAGFEPSCFSLAQPRLKLRQKLQLMFDLVKSFCSNESCKL